MKPILMLILDGVPDRPIRGTTPLKSAFTPNLDELAKRGVSGIMDPIAPGIRPGSDTAHLSLLGYDPRRFYPGRGPFEAAGVGIYVGENDVALRCNFATLKNGIVLDRRAGRIRDAVELEKAINEAVDLDVDFIFKSSTGHRAVLVLKGGDTKLSPKISDTDVKVGEGSKVSKALERSEVAERTAMIVNDFVRRSEEILRDHSLNEERMRSGKLPANTILLRGAGSVPKLKTMREKYGIKPAIIAGIRLIQGVGRICGMDLIPTEGATGRMDTNVRNKLGNAVSLLRDYDFVLVNIKGADEAGHDGDFEAKRDFIERIDESLSVLTGLDDAILAITADHSTPCSVKGHSADPVPVTLVGEPVRTDEVNEYDEFSAPKGGLNRIRGLDLMPSLLDLAGKAEKFGA